MAGFDYVWPPVADQISRAKRSALMSRVKTRDTAPELALRQALWTAGVRGWRLHPRRVPGRPDLAWIGRRLAVFVDGAFWHGHPDHYWGQSGDFWNEKIERNRRRDERVTGELVGAGWTVLRFWDFEVEKEVRRCVDSVSACLASIGSAKTSVKQRDTAEGGNVAGAIGGLRHVADRAEKLAKALEAGEQVEREAIDVLVAELRRVQIDAYGAAKRAAPGEGAKSRILAYLRARSGQVVRGEELAEISGIQEWPRRVRELRVEDGYAITEVGSSAYRLESDQPDRDRATAWKTANVIRRRKGSATERVAAFLEACVGKVVTREQIDYVARIAESVRRVRELRDEGGWPINSHIDEPGLEPSQYRLTSIDPDDRRDPLQRLYPEKVRQGVFERDEYTCRACGRDRVKAQSAGDDRFYLEVHHKVAVADELKRLPASELNDPDNLETLCHADHLKKTAELQARKRQARKSKRKG
jgi:DNA mismatch endonuclease Vsr